MSPNSISNSSLMPAADMPKKAPKAVDIEAIRTNSEAFLEQASGMKLQPYQKQFLEALQAMGDKPRFVLPIGMGRYTVRDHIQTTSRILSVQGSGGGLDETQWQEQVPSSH